MIETAYLDDPLPRSSAFQRVVFTLHEDPMRSKAGEYLRRAYKGGRFTLPQNLDFICRRQDLAEFGTAKNRAATLAPVQLSHTSTDVIDLGPDLCMLFFHGRSCLIATRVQHDLYRIHPWVLKLARTLRLTGDQDPACIVFAIEHRAGGHSLGLKLRHEQQSATPISDPFNSDCRGIDVGLKVRLLDGLLADLQAWIPVFAQGNARIRAGAWPPLLCAMQPVDDAQTFDPAQQALCEVCGFLSASFADGQDISAHVSAQTCPQTKGAKLYEWQFRFLDEAQNAWSPHYPGEAVEQAYMDLISKALPRLGVDLDKLFQPLPPTLDGYGDDDESFTLPPWISRNIHGVTAGKLSAHDIIEVLARMKELGIR